jgi:hypothetical protein
MPFRPPSQGRSKSCCRSLSKKVLLSKVARLNTSKPHAPFIRNRDMAKRHVSSAKRKAPRARGQAVRAQLGTAQRRIAKAITTSATELDLSDLHQLSDLPEAISKLSFLQSLMLDETSVSDLAVLKPLKGLRNLSIDKTNVSDLGPLRNLTALREFSADHTQVSDLTPISGLSALERLSIIGAGEKHA